VTTSEGGTETPRPARWRRVARLVGNGVVVALLLALVALGVLAWHEATTSRLQARYLAEIGARMRYRVAPGESDAIRFPGNGPFDARLGYAGLPQFVQRLVARQYRIEAQARISPDMAEVIDEGLFAPYHEKTRAGLSLRDCAAAPLLDVRYPERWYPRFDAIPPLLVDSLLFIENRELLAAGAPTKNPAVEWDRFAKAVVDQLIRRIDPDHDAAGGSTLATQIEKYRHSPEGRTSGATEKLRQMASASLRAYLGGEDTSAVRRQLVVDYLNTVPLAAMPGYGEVIGIGDGLWAWYGREFGAFNAVLRDEAGDNGRRALAFKQALSLLISQRRPSGYLLNASTEDLEGLTDSYLRLLSTAGLITPALRDAALALPLELRRTGGGATPVSFVSRKAANASRNHLAALLGIGRLYDLDRLDLTATSTLDGGLQQLVTGALRDISEPEAAKAAGLMESRLLGSSDPGKVIYSFTLYERTPGANVVRVQSDNFDQPFDINEGTKLDLGSTAKLRVLVSYLEIIAKLHERYAALVDDEFDRVVVAQQDVLSRWALDYLRKDSSRELGPMLEAALDRSYSGNPGERFFTGGGSMQFSNFDAADNHRVLTVREGLQRSVNLVFVRLMRDIVRHTMFNLPESSATLLEDPYDPKRREYLARFADREGREYLGRFYQKYQDRSAQEAEARLLQGVRATPVKLATIYRSIEPKGDLVGFRAFLERNLPDAEVAEPIVERLFEQYSVENYNLADRGYIAGVHPLELWLVAFLRQHPGSTLAQAIDASAEERQHVYGWLFKTRHKSAQDNRIKTLIEVEAFIEIHRTWKRLGYPFDSLVPSYATALGSSADRPAALAELMGILVNDGVRMPTLRLDRLDFAAGTPYETRLGYHSAGGERVLPAEVAQVARAALAAVVEGGTAKRLQGVFRRDDGAPLTVGGKTGTGDHRFQTFGKGGVLLSSRVVSRSGTFVFYIGDRYFGVLTAYVKGTEAEDYQFTSGLPAQLLKVLAPKLAPTLNREPTGSTACAAPDRAPTPIPSTAVDGGSASPKRESTAPAAR
jgi:membrane peptidoglycan carboxypeptidase